MIQLASGQVLPLVIAVIGVGGTGFVAWQGQRHSDRREDVRWQRERERSAGDAERLERTRTFERRANTYEEFSRVWRDRLDNLPDSPDVFWTTPLYAAMERVRLYGSNAAADAAQRVLEQFDRHLQGEVPIGFVVKAYEAFVSAVRADLAVPD